MSLLLWVASLLLIGLAMMALEVFLPSGGVLGFLSLVAIVAAIAMAFVQQGVAFGLAVVAVTFAAVPAVLALAFRWFPHTPLGRRVLPPPPTPEDVIPGADRRRRLRDHVGRVGRAACELLPWGHVALGDEPFEAVSESGSVAAGAEVEVVGVQGTALVVRLRVARRDAEPAAPAGPAQSDPPSPPRLSSMLEDFEFEDLGGPAP